MWRKKITLCQTFRVKFLTIKTLTFVTAVN